MLLMRNVGGLVGGLCLLLGCSGCMLSRPSVQDATAGALSYTHLAAQVDRNNLHLAQAVQSLRQSPEHLHMQQTLAHLPSSMDKCLVIEWAALSSPSLTAPVTLDPSTPPVMVVIFEGKDEVGFLTNFPADTGDGDPTVDHSVPFTGQGWRAAVWKIPAKAKDAWPALPDDPAKLIPGLSGKATASTPVTPMANTTTNAPAGVLIVITIATPRSVLMAAGIDHGDSDTTPSQTVMHIGQSVQQQFLTALNPGKQSIRPLVVR